MVEGRRAVGGVTASAPRLALPPHPCHHTGMDTSTTPYISPVLKPETMMALTLRYVEGQEAVADQYLRALLRFFMVDLFPRDAFKLVHTFITEVTNDIATFEEEGTASRIDIALRRMVDRAEADEDFMAELTKRAERGY